MNFTTNALHHEDVNWFGTMMDSSSTFHLSVGWRQDCCMWTKLQAELHHCGTQQTTDENQQ
jgi:hypothetical protein